MRRAVMSDVRTLLAAARQRLGCEDAVWESELLLSAVLGRPRSWLHAHPEAVPSAAQATQFEDWLLRRAMGEPVAYLLGRRGFWTFELDVGPGCLIPRPETELLLEEALARMPVDAAIEVADLGTGSGAVAVALAQESTLARVLASDISAEALALARTNVRRLGLEARVRCVQGDWYTATAGACFHLVVSNPPYLGETDPHLAQGDLRFEPRQALVSGADGLEALRTLIAGAPGHLHAGGWLLLEHGADQGHAVCELMVRNGFTEVETMRDLQALERVTAGQWERSAAHNE